MKTIDEKKIAEQTEQKIETKRVPDDELEGVSGGFGETLLESRPESDVNITRCVPVVPRNRPPKEK